MMIFALLSFLAAGEDQIEILASTPSILSLRAEFSEFRKNEQLPITRFIISDNPPTYAYDHAEFDSLRDSREIEESEPVRIYSPMRLEGVTLYPILIKPSYVENSVKYFVKSVEIRLEFTPPSRQPQLSPSMSVALREMILNYVESGDGKPSGYLIIAPDAYVDEVQPLARWKEKKGWHVEVRTLTQTGTNPAQIKDYIANAYNTWSPRPEYVLLAGNEIPAASSALPVGATDYPYTLINSEDFLGELLIGRLPAATELELATMVAKVVGYEMNPVITDPSWFTRSLMVGANQPSGMTTPLPTKRFVKEKMNRSGIPNVDTVYYPMAPSGITSSIDQGALFVNYRSGQGLIGGWPYPSFQRDDVFLLNNGWKLPVVTSITCYTGNFNASACFGAAWLSAGNPGVPKGAVAFIGASAASTSSRWNNCLDYGIYSAICDEEIRSVGPALYRGKMELYANFPDDTTWTSGSSFYFHTYNLLGDPSLEVWTGIPDSFIVTHVPSIQTGSSSFSVHVTNSTSQPVAGAMVSLYKSGEVKKIEFTDASGNVAFNLTTSTQDTLFVTITKHNFKPYAGYTMVNDAAVFVGYDSHTISDPGGNNNGEVNPGETIELGVTLKNYGTSTTATNVSARLSIDDPNVTITDSIKSYGNLAPGTTAAASPYIFDVSQIIRDDHILKFALNITSDQGTWSGSIWITARAPDIVHQRTQVLDGNGILEPGETRDFLVWVKNTGGFEGMNVSGVLRSANSGLVVTDSMGDFGNILAGDSAANSVNPFILSANSSLTPGTSVRFSLILNGNNGFVDTTGFRLTVGIIDSTCPLGPDAYGYYAYDNRDTDYSEAPVYGWVEIDPRPLYNGPGDSISLGADETKTIPLPFSFKFYGNWYDRVSICSNGYIAMDSTWIADMYNWHIPGVGGPPLLISPFWDDLDPNATDSSGVVCYWHDAANHRFIIEYSRIQHIHDYVNPTPSELQTFEVILYDPQYNPTETGDGEIVFQYLDITNDDIWHNYATVGIENYDHTTGIEYTYANIYPAAAASLADGRAIKFTTDPPDTFTGVSELLTPTGQPNILYTSPNPSRGKLNIRYRIKDTGYTIPNLKLAIYDISGRVVKSYNLESSVMNHESSLFWDRIDAAGRRVPAGIYFIILQGDQFSITDKLVLID